MANVKERILGVRKSQSNRQEPFVMVFKFKKKESKELLLQNNTCLKFELENAFSQKKKIAF